MKTSFVAIVGGGIAGLSAAYELHRRGVPFQLFEASDRFGGILRTDRAGELLIDAGPDAMLARKPAGIELCDQLGIAGRLVAAIPPRTAFVVRGRTLQPLSSFGWNVSLRHADVAETDIPPERMSPDCSIAEYFREHFPADALDYYAEPVLAGIHAGDVERLSMPALFPDMLAGRAGRAPDPQGEFRSFPRGMQELVDALVGALPAAALHLSTPVAALAELLAAGPTIVAIPAHAAAFLFDAVDHDLAALCRAIPYVSSGIVVLAYPRDAVRHPLAGSGFVVPRVERDYRILAATWLSSKWPGRAPDGVVLMRAFFGGARDPGAMHLSDDEVVALAHRDVSRLSAIEAAPAFSRVYRWVNGTPQYEVGYLERLAAIHARLAHRPGLFVTGAGFGAIGIPDCIADGRATAARCIERHT